MADSNETQDAPVQITATPKKDQLVEHGGKLFKTIQEGKAYILVPPNARTLLDPQAKSKGDDGSQVQNVFYNPIQQFNRDLSVLAIKAFGEDFCRRSRQKKTVEHEKNVRKRERKRKRKEGVDVDEEQDVRSVKVRRVESGASAVAQDGESSADGARHNGDGGHDLNSEDTADGGVAVPKEENVANDTLTEDALPSVKRESDSTATTAAKADETTNNDEEKPQSEWRPRFRILDALSATGLRALRYASEIPFTTALVANDRDKNAVKNIDLNVQHNKLTPSITTNVGDALGHMYGVAFPSSHSHGSNGKYDVIDLDPYGTAAPFIDAALQSLEDGGLLCVTYTDSGVFASCGYSEKTFSLYGGLPIKGSHSHEGGLRLVLHSIATAAAKYSISIEPLLSLSIDFYVRLFIRVRKSAQDVKFLAGKTMLVYGCDHGCGAWSTQFLGRHERQSQNGKNTVWKYSIAQAPTADRLCEHCGSKTHIAGPMWGGPLHNPAFVEKILEDLDDVSEEVYQTKSRIEGMLSTALDELCVNSDTMEYRPIAATKTEKNAEDPIIPQVPPECLDHHPFFFIPSALCKVIKAQAPPEHLVKGALRHAGYIATRSHCKAGSIKADAPWSAIWEVLREWVRQKSPIKDGALKENTPGWKILQATKKVAEDQTVREEAEAEMKSGAENGASEAATPEIVTENGVPDLAAAAPKLGSEAKRITVVFDEKLGRDKPGKRLVRYQMNPRENWGPMSKAKGHA